MQYGYGISISPHRTVTDEGYLLVKDCSIATLGGRRYAAQELPQDKPDASGWVTVFRTADELFNPATIESFAGKPVTIEHPNDTVLLDPATWKRHVVGVVLNPRRGQGEQSDAIVADVLIQNKDAISTVLTGLMKELSAGFTSETRSLLPGVSLESRIRGNHLAIVPSGRCGPMCALRDAAFKEKPMTTDNPEVKKDADGAGSGGENPAATPAPASDVAQVLASIQQSIEALTERVAKIEGGATDADPAPAAADPEKKADADPEKDPAACKTDAKPLSAADVRRIFDEALKAKADQAKADAAVVADAAVIAPGLDKNTPDLAKQACIEYAKTDSGKAVVEAYGGMTAVEANPKQVLHQCAVYQRLQAAAPMKGAAKADASASSAPSFFEQADKLWGRK